MVDWLAGKRMKGTSTERASSYTPDVGGWVELGRHTLGSATDTLDVSSLDDKRYYMTLVSDINSGATQAKYRYNNDSDTNYSDRYSGNGAADGTHPSVSYAGFHSWTTTTVNRFGVAYHANGSTNEKLNIIHGVGATATGAGTAPERVEVTGKHAQTTNPISRIQCYNDAAGSFATGSELVVLGYDPDDTHTNNFWEELTSDDLSGSSQDISFTAKKYLWVQCYITPTGGTFQPFFREPSDTGSNYSVRRSLAGASDATFTSIDSFGAYSNSADSTPHFLNMFIINNASNEKLVICHTISQNTAGAGTAPTRAEYVSKWADTSNQIDGLTVGRNSGTGTMGTGSIIKVWGAD